jgi:uncharacterized membrane protein (DUF373 family)
MKMLRFRRFFGAQTSFGISGILQNLQNVITMAICLLMFWIMAAEIYYTVLATIRREDFQTITSHLLFVFVMIELFRIMIFYLEEQRILLGTIIEVAIVSLLREMILVGVLHIAWAQLLAATALLLVLGGILTLQKIVEKEREKLEQITIRQQST